ncbi:MAG: BamA/TamA family outer membrane protein [Bacteroidales bacterium]|nr:BamA/TamA family outer membrane protein [Bacteroidales bacterium]
MEKNSSNKNIYFLIYSLLSFLAVLFIISCNPTKYVPQNETLLDKNHITINNDGIKKAELEPYIRQKPNKRIFGTRFHLGLYNLSNIEKQKWPHTWLREIGEEPVIYDPYSTEKSREQIESYVESKGYFDRKVTDTVETAARKSEVYYTVNLTTPYTIRNLYYEIADTTIRKLVYHDSVGCLIIRGKPFDVDVLQDEKSRIERTIKDKGFYNFSGDHIYFNIDSTIGNRQVNIFYGVKKYSTLNNYNRAILVNHPIYSVNRVYIFPDFVPKDALEGGTEYLRNLDTIEYKGYYFIKARKDESKLNYDVIVQSLYLKPGSPYSLSNTEQSQTHLLSLKIFRLVKIFYTELPGQLNEQFTELKVDCNIQLTLLSQQSFRVEVEGTHTEGNLGGALNLIYSHKNLFHGAELFNLKLKGAYEALSQKQYQLRSSQEFGAETSLRFPKFLLPFIKKEDFIRKYNPTTTLLAAYNYQSLPFYTRTIANATFGYNWYGGKFVTHMVNPVQLNFVRLPKDKIHPDFQTRIDTTPYLAYSYKSVMILGSNYSFIFNDQQLQRSKDYRFIRINVEASGNILRLLGNLTGTRDSLGSYNIFKQPFAQYVRADIDMRYNRIINDVSSVVFRGFIGAGIPYGNSIEMPFEKQYFGGGANGIRAWQVRSLGPGSYRSPDEDAGTETLNIPYQTANIKLEANAEYRFNLFWILEGALFLDVGNIWTTNKKDNSRPGSLFKFNKFYDDLAVGTGLGLRFDLDFVLLRADVGMKLRDPGIQTGSKWVTDWSEYSDPYGYDGQVFTLVVGIGYPF